MFGKRCEKRLECSSQLEPGGARETSAGTTSNGGDDGSNGVGGSCGFVTCTCSEPRRIAVFAHTVLPKVRRDISSDYGHEVFGCHAIL